MTNGKRIYAHKFTLPALAAALIFLVVSCGNPPPPETDQPLIHEGMSVEELKEILGAPDSIYPGGTVYDANTESTKKVERWMYPKRNVLVIDDTVKSPAIH